MSALVLAAAFAFFLGGASPALAPRDAGDMAAAAFTLGVAHPPGYPLYAVVGRAWLAVMPLGNPAYRLAVLSCLAGAFAVMFVFMSVRRRSGPYGALASAAALAFSFPLWKFALIQEKYSLHALFLAVLLFLSEGPDEDAVRRCRLSAFLFGLGLVNHQSLVLWLPSWLWLWRGHRRPLVGSWPWLFAGLTPYLFVAVRLGSLSEALAVVLRAQYGSATLSSSLAGPLTPGRAFALAAWSLKAAAESVSWPCAAVAAAGAVLAWRRDRARAAALLLGAALTGPLFAVLSRFDASSWVARSVLEPSLLVPALTAAAFAGEAVAALGPRAPAAAAALAACALFVRATPAPERRDDFLALDYARNLRRAVPPGSALLAGGDTALFGLRWLDLTEPRAAREVAGAGLVDAAGWLAARPGAFVSGLPPETLAAAGFGAKGKPIAPEGLVARTGARPGAWGPPVVLRRSASWARDESYARDAKLAYAFAAWSTARLLEAQGSAAPDALDLAAAAFDPEDYRLE